MIASRFKLTIDKVSARRSGLLAGLGITGKGGSGLLVKPLTLLGNPIRVLVLTLKWSGKENTTADMVRTNMRRSVLLIRIILGLVFGVLLSRTFFPAAGVWLIFLIAGLLVVFAYIFEVLHK